MFKSLKLALVILIGLTGLVGCSSGENKVDSSKLQVITSFYPLYELSVRIGGKYVDVTSLVPTGVEPHDWTPKSRDMMAITNADVFVYNGHGFEGWVDDFLDNQEDNNLVEVVASKHIKLIQVPTSSKQSEYDPHVWTSPVGAIQMAINIYDGLVSKDPSHQAYYKKNLNELTNELIGIKKIYEQSVSGASTKEIVVSHDAFGYLARDFGLSQISIMGLSPEAEPTAKDLKDISDFVKKHRVKFILVEELSSPKVAETLANDLGVYTLTFNPLEGLTEKQENEGETYLTLMKSNAEILKNALQ